MTNSHIAPLLEAVGIVGSRAALARALGISKAAVTQWVTPGEFSRRIPPKQCVRIEALTDGRVTRRLLRPDDWQEFWPELADAAPAPAQPLAPPQQPVRPAPAAREVVAGA